MPDAIILDRRNRVFPQQLVVVRAGSWSMAVDGRECNTPKQNRIALEEDVQIRGA